MITPLNRIIIVDDQITELQRLANAFLKNGLGCRTFEYDKSYNEPLDKVRLAFFDVDLGEKNINTNGLSQEEIEAASTSIYNDLAFAINQYISKSNGPYALIFWTKNKPLIEGFKKYVNNPDRGYSNTAKPYLIECFDKNELTETSNVVPKLDELLINDKIKFYLELEENARLAGSNTVDKLHSIIPKDEEWSVNTKYFENIDKVLSKIAVNVLGYDYAKKKPIKGVYEGLSQLILKEFLDSNKGINPQKLMSSLLNSNEQKEIEFPEKIIANKLNTIFHIDESNDFSNSERGGVFEIKLDSLKSEEFKPSYHFSLSAYFKSLETFNSELFFRLRSDLEEDVVLKIKSEIEFIAVEISASCDYSQNKMRNNKFILGILTPTIGYDKLDLKSISKSLLYKEIPNFYYNEKEYSIYLNLNFVFSDSELSFIGKPKFILKKEIIDMIGNRYANHVSRIGITSF
jgi:hypothetical protein